MTLYRIPFGISRNGEEGSVSMTAEMEGKELPDLQAVVEARFAQSMSVPEIFFTHEAARIAEACWAIARRFHQGGRLLAFGNGAWATDAQHVSVEFVHPVIVGKRALPALALTNDSASLSGLMAGGDRDMPFVRQLRVLARPQDIAMGFSPDGSCTNVVAALKVARQMGLLTLGLTGGDGGLLKQARIDFCFTVQAHDPLVIQEDRKSVV